MDLNCLLFFLINFCKLCEFLTTWLFSVKFGKGANHMRDKNLVQASIIWKAPLGEGKKKKGSVSSYCGKNREKIIFKQTHWDKAQATEQSHTSQSSQHTCSSSPDTAHDILFCSGQKQGMKWGGNNNIIILERRKKCQGYDIADA